MSRRSFRSQAPTSPRKPVFRRPIVLAGGLLLAALIWFAPAIVVNSPLKDQIIASATSDFEGTIVIDSMSAGWLSSLRANNVVVFDAQGERLAEVPTVVIDKNLIALLRDRTDLGSIRIQQPVAHLVARSNGSNIEDAASAWIEPSGESSNISCAIELEGGTLNVTDATTGAQWSARDLNLAVELPKDSAAPLTMRLDTKLDAPSGQTGELSAEGLWQAGTGVAEASRGNLSVQAAAVPIELASSVLQRTSPGVAMSGLLHGKLQLDWGQANQTARAEGLAVQRLHLVAPPWIGTDQVNLESLTINGELTHQSGNWQIQQATIESDVGQLQADGSAVVRRVDGEDWLDELQQAIRYGRFRVAGNLDLARLAQMLPNTLRIREGTHISTGQISLALASDTAAAGQRWDGRVEASNLAAMHAGRRLTWDKPVTITVAAHETDGAVVFDNVSCDSSFLQLVGSGTPERGSAELSGDLSRFASELNQFVDLGNLKMAGRLEAKLGWQQTNDQRLRLDASGTARQFELVTGAAPPWREDHLSVTFAGVGDHRGRSWQAIEQGELDVRSGGDQLKIELLSTPAGAVRQNGLPLRIRMNGELNRWLARLQPVFVAPGWSLGGVVDLAADANVGADHLQIAKADLQVKGLQASNGAVFISEPVVKITTSGHWERKTNSFVSDDTTLASQSIALRAGNVVVKSEGGLQVAGHVGYRGDVGRLFALFSDPRQPADHACSGTATGQAQLRVVNGVTSGDLSADIRDFEYLTRDVPRGPAVMNVAQGNGWSTTWREPQLKVGAEFSYEPQSDLVSFTRLEATGDTVGVAAAGKVTDLSRQCHAELDGQVAYDLQKLQGLLRPMLGDRFQVAGRDTRPFRFRGPLFASTNQRPTDGLTPVSLDSNLESSDLTVIAALNEMIAQASLGWSSASLQGFSVGAGELNAEMSDGTLRIAPLDLPVSDGRVHLAPQISLDRSPMIMTLPPGLVVERVQITPEMCTSWLKYVAPLVADATAAQGRFSVTLQGATIPLENPHDGDIEGTIEVHSAQIGPGPLSQQLLMLASQIKALSEGRPFDAANSLGNRWLDLPAQQVAFRMAENRVYHEGLQMEVKDVVIRTRGSVGTDQTLSLVAEVPIRDQWLSSSRYLASLRGQTLQVPIHGTLSKPRLDQRALQQITRQTATGAVNRLIEDETGKLLNKGLNKLFGPPPQQ
jgi:hypothetical protein